ncbi:MAG: hypothetical protein LC777_12985 [Actinobacteria bacterium]|nr:hypothetical protein [Actinomycetota bacterium]
MKNSGRNSEPNKETLQAEATFFGPGASGKWKLNGILGCADAVRLTIAIRKS